MLYVFPYQNEFQAEPFQWVKSLWQAVLDYTCHGVWHADEREHWLCISVSMRLFKFFLAAFVGHYLQKEVALVK